MTPRPLLLVFAFAALAPCIVLASSANAGLGHTITLSVSCDGSPPFSYQWMKNGQPIQHEVGQNLVIHSATLADSGRYTVMVMNPFGSAVSDTADVSVGVIAASATSGGGGGGGGSIAPWFVAVLVLLGLGRRSDWLGVGFD